MSKPPLKSPSKPCRHPRPLSLDRFHRLRSTRFAAVMAHLTGLALLGCGQDSPVTTTKSLPQDSRQSTDAAGITVTPIALRQDDGKPAAQTSARTSLPQQWVDRMIAQYRQANQYSDRGVVRLVYRRNGQRFEDTAPLSVAFVRDKALHLVAYAIDAVIRENRLLATIEDPLIDNMDGQWLDRPLAANSFGLAEIYAEPALTHFATAGLGGPSLQLELLLSEKPLGGLFESNATLTLGDKETVAGRECQTVIIVSDSVTYQLWIDRQTGLLRRVDLPREATGLVGDPAVTDVKLTIDFIDAAFTIPIDERFQLAVEAAGTKPKHRLKQFVPPPPPIVSNRLGERLPDFAISGRDGGLLASEEGSDRQLTVLMWIADHPASRMAASQLQAIADSREQAETRDTRIILVMAEPTATTDTLNPPDTTGKLLRSWRIGLPYADDTLAVGRDVFQIAEAPTLAVIGPTGLLEWFQPRVGPEMAIQLPAMLDDLAAGKQVGAEIRKQYEADQTLYKKMLDDAR